MWRCYTTKRTPHNLGTQDAKHTGKRRLTSAGQLEVKPPNPPSWACHVEHTHDTSKRHQAHQAHQYDETLILCTVKRAPATPRAVCTPKRTSRGRHSPTQTTGRVFLGSPKLRVKTKAPAWEGAHRQLFIGSHRHTRHKMPGGARLANWLGMIRVSNKVGERFIRVGIATVTVGPHRRLP